ncbi:exonuclease domain-containing protein [Microbacterium sp. YY-01]|uniref:exonuclease domain-containing protein n=1 Tax=Microbacterium sp. YY-01 TaxID=3421634 RepID=UPI003D186AC5
MPVDFTAIDFETANSHPASACSVGLVRVRNGVVVAHDTWLIQPPHEHSIFNEWNIRIHGIHPEHVTDAPQWHNQLERLCDFTGNDILVAHNTRFDIGVLYGASEATGTQCPPFRSLCSLHIARRTYQLDSYRLPVAAAAAGYGEFDHHNAAADAAACAHIIIDAAQRAQAASVEELATLSGVAIVNSDQKSRAARSKAQ